MGKVLAFPVKKELPQSLEGRFYMLGREYAETLYLALTALSDDEPTQEDLAEINELVILAYAKGLNDAIEDMEKAPSN